MRQGTVKQVVILLYCCLFAFLAEGQGKADTLKLTVSTINSWSYVSPNVRFYIDRNKTSSFQPFSSLEPVEYNYRTIPIEFTPYPHYFYFSIHNDTRDSVSYYFYNYQGGPAEVQAEGRILNSFRLKTDLFIQTVIRLHLPPDATIQYTIRANPIQDIQFGIASYVIAAPAADRFFKMLNGNVWVASVEAAVLCGMLLMMFLYILIKYWQVKSTVYLFYAAYLFFFLIFFALSMIQNLDKDIGFSRYYYGYIEQALQIAAYTMYFPFAQRFLNTKSTLPVIHYWMNRIVWILCGYAVLHFILLFIPALMVFKWFLWDVMRIFLLGAELVFTILLLRAKSPYIRFLLLGSICLAFFGMLSMIFTVHGNWIAGLPAGLNRAIVYFYIGVALETLFFSTVLGYKNRMDEIQKVQAQEALKREAERQKFQQYRVVMEALESERGRIAKDLHDGLGGMLSGVKFSLANIKTKIGLNGDQDLMYERALDQLGGSIQELRRVAHDMMPDVLVNHGLSTALSDYCSALSNMDVVKINFQSIGDEKRSESYREIIIYRVTQELITNVIRHAKATEILVQIVYDEGQLAITVEDNGQGFDYDRAVTAKGMGLRNVASRVAFLTGKINVNSTGTGTSIYMEIPL